MIKWLRADEDWRKRPILLINKPDFKGLDTSSMLSKRLEVLDLNSII